MRTLILGLGNPILGDDSVGLRVVQLLRDRVPDSPTVDIEEDCWGGLRLMERMVGYDRAVIIDAICTANAEAGTLHYLSPDDLPTQHSASGHDANLSTALALGRQAGAKLPRSEDILILGIEAAEVFTFNESCTSAVEAAIPRAAHAVMNVIENQPVGAPP